MTFLPFTHPIHLALGFIIWSVWFVGVYAGLSLLCFIPPDPAALGPFSWINITLLVYTFATTALLLWLAVRCWRTPRTASEHEKSFIVRVSAGLYLCAAVGVLAVGLPILALPPCV